MKRPNIHINQAENERLIIQDTELSNGSKVFWVGMRLHPFFSEYVKVLRMANGLVGYDDALTRRKSQVQILSGPPILTSRYILYMIAFD